jgi:hypothetical protein
VERKSILAVLSATTDKQIALREMLDFIKRHWSIVQPTDDMISRHPLFENFTPSEKKVLLPLLNNKEGIRKVTRILNYSLQ